MRILKLLIEYDGTDYEGWQFQPRKRTIQGELEKACAEVLGAPTTVYGASRTDAGVHARGQVAHLVTDRRIRLAALQAGLNALLPRAILVRDLREAAAGFHARYDACAKHYRYRIIRGRSPLRARFAWEVRYRLDLGLMDAARRPLLGTHDFGPLCHQASATTHATVAALDLTEHGDEIIVDIHGDRFLYKMVRRIVGILVTVGRGYLAAARVPDLLAGRAGIYYQTAPAGGLVLMSVSYARERR